MLYGCQVFSGINTNISNFYSFPYFTKENGGINLSLTSGQTIVYIQRESSTQLPLISFWDNRSTETQSIFVNSTFYYRYLTLSSTTFEWIGIRFLDQNKNVVLSSSTKSRSNTVSKIRFFINPEVFSLPDFIQI